MDGKLNPFHQNVANLQKDWGWFLALGIILIVLGSLAIVMPLAATLTAEFLLGWVFLIGGVVMAFHAFRSRRWGRFFLEILIGALYFAAGLLLLYRPLVGMFGLTIFLGAFFTIEGIFRIIQALQMRPIANWGWVLISGIISLLLGFVVVAGLPLTALWIAGLVVGIDLLFGGWSMVMISVAARNALHEGRTYCIGDQCFQP